MRGVRYNWFQAHICPYYIGINYKLITGKVEPQKSEDDRRQIHECVPKVGD